MSDPIPFDSATTRLALPLLFTAQAQKEAFHNEALARLDAFVHPCVQGEASAPPPEAVHGDCWLVGEAAAGAWSGREGSLAALQSGQWLFAEPFVGLRVFDLAAGQFALFTGTWQKAAPIEEPSGGLNVDSQARAAIGAVLSALRAAGIFPLA